MEIKRNKGIRRGSICVECSLVLPLFLIITLVLFSMLEMIHIHGKMNVALHAAARELSAYSYLLAEPDKEWTDTEGKLIGFVGAESFVRERMTSILGRDWIENSLIVGKEAGIHYYRSKLDWDNQEIDLIITYRVKPYITISNLGSLNMMNRCRVKMWIGYQIPKEEETYVYVTKTGTVYHKSLYCSYLNPSICLVSDEELGKKRNRSGGKYYPCETCAKRKKTEDPSSFYITDYGDRFHTSVSCKSLKRTIEKIRLSEVGGRFPCIKCGGN